MLLQTDKMEPCEDGNAASPVARCERLLDECGLIACLFALARAVRVVNDGANPQELSPEAIRVATAREYVASQLTGLAALWRLHAPPGAPR